MSNRIPCRLEELPFVASALRHTFERDKADFKSFFPKKFPDNILEILDGKITPVENVIKTEIPTREIKKVTGQILAESLGLRPELLLLEGYVIDAVNLSCGVDDFGIRDVRNSLQSGDPELLVKSLGILNPNIEKNIDALKEQGFSDDSKSFFRQKQTTLDTLNKSQNDLMSDRAQVVAKNNEKFVDLWDMLALIMDHGKRIYRTNDPSKLPDYTYTQIIKKIRRERGEDGEGEEVKPEA